MEQQLSLDFSRKILPRYASPSTDNERLLTLQARWLEDGDPGAEAMLWEAVRGIAGRCVRGIVKRRGLHMGQEEIEDRTGDAVLYVMRRYRNKRVRLKTPSGRVTTYLDEYGWNYCVVKDFVSVVVNGVRHAVDYRTKSERLVDYVDSEKLERLMDQNGYEEEYGDEDNGMP